jgi:N-acetylglucosaminyl-diphospho-decaprenol L-rhamnosyltransferase
MGESANLAIIIVSYNTSGLLRSCLRSLEVQASVVAQVVVADNASSDGSPEMVAVEFPLVRVLNAGRNLGFAAGNNLGLRQLGFGSEATAAGRPEYVLFLNPDTEVREDAVARMREFLCVTPNAGVVGPSLVYGDGSFQHSAFRFPTLCQLWFDFFPWPGRFVESSLNGRYSRALYAAGRPFPIDHPLGAAFMTRAAVIQRVGLLDEGFFMYAEEIDWCMRVRQAGWEAYCLPTAVVMHHSGGSTRQQTRQMDTALWRSRFRLFEKHYNPLFVGTARLLATLGTRYRARQARTEHGEVR